jgi:hypothetical protein
MSVVASGTRRAHDACAICERPIANAPADAPAVLCPLCAAHPGLVRAFTARLRRRRRTSQANAGLTQAEAARQAETA